MKDVAANSELGDVRRRPSPRATSGASAGLSSSEIAGESSNLAGGKSLMGLRKNAVAAKNGLFGELKQHHDKLSYGDSVCQAINKV